MNPKDSLLWLSHQHQVGAVIPIPTILEILKAAYDRIDHLEQEAISLESELDTPKREAP